MKRYRRFFLFLFITLLFIASCSRDNFSVRDVRLSREKTIDIDSNGKVYSSYETLVLTSRIDGGGRFRSVYIKAPGGDLTWESGISLSGRLTLEITQGAIFPEGEYELIFSGDDGQEIKVKAEVGPYEVIEEERLPVFLPYRGLISDNVVDFTLKDSNGNVIDRCSINPSESVPESCFSTEYTFRDRYNNLVKVNQNLVSSETN